MYRIRILREAIDCHSSVGGSPPPVLRLRSSVLEPWKITDAVKLGKVSHKGNKTMKLEYDSRRDLLYIWFGKPGEKAARTETVVPGVHADFDRGGRLLGLEVLDASEVLDQKFQFEFWLTPAGKTGSEVE